GIPLQSSRAAVCPRQPPSTPPRPETQAALAKSKIPSAPPSLQKVPALRFHLSVRIPWAPSPPAFHTLAGPSAPLGSPHLLTLPGTRIYPRPSQSTPAHQPTPSPALVFQRTASSRLARGSSI